MGDKIPLANSYSEYEKALLRLIEALAQPKNDFIRDSVIQRFEFTVELAWKVARKIYGFSDVSPKMVIREMAQQGLIDDPAIWFDLIEKRNLSSHTYKENIAEIVFKAAQEAIPIFQQLLEKFKEQNKTQ